MRRWRLFAVAMSILCLEAAGDTFRRGRKNDAVFSATAPHSSSVDLTGDNCTGVAQGMTDGTNISWTRATAASCQQNNGVYTSLSSGQPRCSSSGCLIEEARTNIGLYSSTMTNASGYVLSTAGSGGGGAATWGTTTDVTDVFGGTSAGKLLTPNMAGGEGGTNIAAAINAYTISGLSGSYTLSLFGTTTSGTRTYYLWGNSGASISPSVCTATTSGAICTLTKTAPGNFRVGYDLRTSTPQQTGQSAGNVYFSYPQLESGAFATSPIPTTSASVTRNADNVSFTKPAWMVDGQGCVSVTIVAQHPTANQRAFSFGSGGSIYIQSTTSIRVEDGTNTVTATGLTDITNRSITIRAYWTASTLGLVADGVTATGSYDGTMVGTTAYLGSSSGSSNFLNGLMSNVKLGSVNGGCL